MNVTEIGKIALAVLAILIPLQLYIGYRLSGKSGSSAKHYFIGGGELPFALIFFADFATAMGVGTFVGYTGKAYEIGLNQFWMLFGEQGTKMVFALLMAGFIGQYSYNTINEFMEQEMFHDKWLRAAGGILMCFPLVCTTGAQAIGISTLLSAVMGIEPLTGIWIAALTAILYTVMGGMWAIAWTDLIQGVIRIIVGCLFFIVVLVGFHGIGGIKASALAVKPELWSMSSAGPWAALSLLLAPLTGQFTHQSWWQRCFAAKNAKTARNAFICTAACCIIMVSGSILMGIAAHGANPNLPKPDMAFAWLLTNWLNPVLAAFMVVTIIGADMTLSAGFLNSGVTLLVMDVVKPFFAPQATDKNLVHWARWLTLVLGIGTVWVALTFPSVMSAVLFGYAASGGGLFMPLVVGLLWKGKDGKTRVTKNAAIASLILGGGTVILFELTPSLFKIFHGGIVPGLAVSFVVTVVVSLLDRHGIQKSDSQTKVIA